MSLKHDIHNRSHCDFEIHVKMTGVNRPWGKSTSLILDFPQALFTRVNIPAKQGYNAGREYGGADMKKELKKLGDVRAAMKKVLRWSRSRG